MWYEKESDRAREQNERVAYRALLLSRTQKKEKQAAERKEKAAAKKAVKKAGEKAGGKTDGGDQER